MIQYDSIAVNTIVKNKDGEVSSCDILYTEDLDIYNRGVFKIHCSSLRKAVRTEIYPNDNMVIGTSAIIDTEIDGAVGMNSGIFHNPFIIWGRYKKKWFRYYLNLSFPFHHTQMDGAHAGKFLANLQKEITDL